MFRSCSAWSWPAMPWMMPVMVRASEWNRQNTGCILGVVGVSIEIIRPLMSRLQYPVWEKVLKASGVSEADTQKMIEKFKLAYVGWEENSFPGSLANVVSGRVANRFDLGGTNCVIDAACATLAGRQQDGDRGAGRGPRGHDDHRRGGYR